MKWTSQPPTQEGYYFYRMTADASLRPKTEYLTKGIAEIHEGRVMFPGVEILMPIPSLSGISYEWLGPFTPESIEDRNETPA